jgi:hypothetical protein
VPPQAGHSPSLGLGCTLWPQLRQDDRVRQRSGSTSQVFFISRAQSLSSYEFDPIAFGLRAHTRRKPDNSSFLHQ